MHGLRNDERRAVLVTLLHALCVAKCQRHAAVLHNLPTEVFSHGWISMGESLAN